MNIAFFGPRTDDKIFFILCLAKIMSASKKVVVFSGSPVSFEDNPGNVYDYCGLEVQIYKPEEDLRERLSEDSFNFLDLDDYHALPEGFKAVAVSELSRRSLETCVGITGKYCWENPSLEIIIVYMNLLEYCRIGQKYLDMYWERSVPSYTKIAQSFPLYFEDTNKAVMVEAQFSDRIPLRKLTPSLKAGYISLIHNLFALEFKDAKKLFKKAERMN